MPPEPSSAPSADHAVLATGGAARLTLIGGLAVLLAALMLVAALALVEFVTGWNPFVHVPGSGSLYEAWSPIQERGGIARAEGARSGARHPLRWPGGTVGGDQGRLMALRIDVLRAIPPER